MRLSTKCLLALALASSVMSSAAAQSAPAQSKADAAKGEQLFAQGDEKRGLPACASCHGPGGNSPGAANPKVAGQHADYVFKQLVNFKPKAQGQRPERENPVMTPFAAMLTVEDMRNISAYLAQQTQKPAVAKNKDSIALGQKIYRAGIAEKNVPACAACHGPTGAGIPAQYPRIGGQFGEYTEAQLLAFRTNARKNSAQMSAIAARMSDAEIKAVADYVAGLR